MILSELALESPHEIQSSPERYQSVVGQPWRRMIARSFDQILYGITWAIIQFFILRWHPPSNFITSTMDSYIMLFMMIAIEPALLSFTGTTPGKMIMGLEIRNLDGSRLTYRQGFFRMVGVFSRGLGFGIPFYSMVRSWRCSEATLRGETLEWDEGLRYEIKDTCPARGWLMAAACMTALACVFWVIMQAQLPINRGDLTPEAYAANVNDMISRPYRESYGRRMTAEGKWFRPDELNRGTIHYDFDGPPPDHHLMVENGIVTGVRFELERNLSNFFQSTYSHQKELMIMAFVGAQKDISGYRLMLRSGVEELTNRQGNYTHQIAGFKITNQVEHSGYTHAGDGWLIPKDGEEQFYHLIFTIEKME